MEIFFIHSEATWFRFHGLFRVTAFSICNRKRWGWTGNSNTFPCCVVTKAWVALGKFLGEFVYLAVEICHRWTLLSATPSFQVRKNFGNRQKHQRRRSAWVGQADFGKLELNNRNHSGNCQRLVMNVIHLKHDHLFIYFKKSTRSNFQTFAKRLLLGYPSPFQVFFRKLSTVKGFNRL